MQQNEIARQYAVAELEQASGKWRSDEINWMLKNMFHEKEKKEDAYQALEKVKDFPHRILAGWTWSEIYDGVIARGTLINQIINFYEREYPEFIDELHKDKHGKDTPIWVVIRPKEGELIHNMVYPVITRFHGHSRHIVLAINE